MAERLTIMVKCFEISMGDRGGWVSMTTFKIENSTAALIACSNSKKAPFRVPSTHFKEGDIVHPAHALKRET